MWESIRKFGLEYSDLPTMLSNISAMLRILALNIDGRNNKRVPLIFIITTAIQSALYVYGYVISGFWFTFWRSRELGDVTAAFVEFSLKVTSEIVAIKLFCMMFYQTKLRALTSMFLASDACIVEGSRYSINMQKALRDIKKRAMTYWLILMVDAVLYTMKPFVMPGRHLTMDGFVIYGLEPMLESPNFEIATTIMSIDIMFICYAIANVTCFLILIIGYVEAQMITLSEEMTHIWEDAVHHCKQIGNEAVELNGKYYTETEIQNEYIQKQLIEILKKHAMARSHLQDIEDIMRIPNAIGFVLLIMGLIAELLGGLEHTWLQLPFTMLQLSVDCYLGQKIIDSNLKFEQAVYFCKWEMFNEPNKKIVLVMLQNSQKTMKLTAGGMATLSFICLMSIIKTTYSAYTTLRSMV